MKAITNYRYWVLTLLGIIAVSGIAAFPADELSLAQYFVVLFATKAVAVVAAAITFSLGCHWYNQGRLPELSDLDEEV